MVGSGEGLRPSQKIYEFFISKWRDMLHSGCAVFKIRVSHADENDSDLRYSEVPLKGKNKTLVKILGGVVNTGRPLQVKYWRVVTPAALTPISRSTVDF